jgi:hypothetical protein
LGISVKTVENERDTMSSKPIWDSIAFSTLCRYLAIPNVRKERTLVLESQEDSTARESIQNAKLFTGSKCAHLVDALVLLDQSFEVYRA